MHIQRWLSQVLKNTPKRGRSCPKWLFLRQRVVLGMVDVPVMSGLSQQLQHPFLRPVLKELRRVPFKKNSAPNDEAKPMAKPMENPLCSANPDLVR